MNRPPDTATPWTADRARCVRVTFRPDIAMSDVQGTYELARMATESLFGAERMLVETAIAFDAPSRLLTFDTSSEVARTLAMVFLGYVRREFGDEAYRVEQHSLCTDKGGRAS